MNKRRAKELIESSASVSAEKVLFKNSLKRSGLRKLRSEVETSEQQQQQQKKQKRGGNYHKRRYHAGLLKNNIALNNSKSSLVIKKDMNIEKITTQFKKIKTMNHLKNVVNAVERYQPLSPQEKSIKSVYLFILTMHLDRPWLFYQQNTAKYSEADYIYKFWAYVFELSLGYKPNVVLRWGDTISTSCKKAGLNMKLDLRLVFVEENVHAVDTCTGEVAKKATVEKIYRDKLKSTIATKCHLNTILKEVPFIRPKDVPLIKMPILQIAGFSGKLSLLRVSKKKEYALEEVCSFSFPRSLPQLQDRSLEHFINVLTTIDDLLENIQKIINDSSSSSENDIERILNGKGKEKRLNVDAWISKAIFDKENDDDDHEDDDDDEDDESEEGASEEDESEEDKSEDNDESEDDEYKVEGEEDHDEDEDDKSGDGESDADEGDDDVEHSNQPQDDEDESEDESEEEGN